MLRVGVCGWGDGAVGLTCRISVVRTKLAPNPGFAAQLMGWGPGLAKDHAGTKVARDHRPRAEGEILPWKPGRDFGSERRNSSRGYDHRRLPATLQQRVIYGAALVSFAVLCGWTVCDLAVTDTDPVDGVGTRGDKLEASASPGDRLAVLKHSFNVFAAPFATRFSLDGPSQNFAENTPLQADSDGALAPLPPVRAATRNRPDAATPARKTVATLTPRPGLPPNRTTALRDDMPAGQVDSDKAADRPTLLQTIFAKLFGKPAPVRLAYAATDDGGLGAGRDSVAARYDQSTAVYDISAHTVYLPDGTRLEAHSGFGNLLDDPNHPDEKMRGVTPPNVYDLELRESRFHGVRALRLIPEDESKTLGRSGLLVHSFMLGPNGDSNGCVSIKNYDAFLRAYRNHQIKRLAVVARLD
jgi:Protein of unknown function (DUF2778)